MRKLAFYEKVKVLDTASPQYVGRIGVVLGISEEDGQVFGYAVSFVDDAEGTVMFKPEELHGTGEMVDRNVFYDDDERVRVVVHGDKGAIADES